MNHSTCFELKNKYGTFNAYELVTPCGKEYSSDIVCVFHDYETDDGVINTETLDYSFGASMMTEEDIIRFLYSVVGAYVADHAETEEELREALRTFCYNGEEYLRYSWE